MNVGSLFTGVGGFDLGFERAGMSIKWQCEADPKCREVLARHWPGVPCFEDVRSVQLADGRADQLRPVELDAIEGPAPGRVARGGHSGMRIDVLCGGFPCQDLSVAGKRAGLAGDRSGLFFEFMRIADAVLDPGGWIVLENVPGLFSSNGGRDFAVVLASLADLGFHDLAWRVLDSRYFGVPQRRRRVFIVARRSTGSSAQQVLLEPESGGGDFAPSRKAGARSAATLSHGSASPGISSPGRRKEDDVNIVAGALDLGRGGADDNSAQANHLVAHTLTAEGHDASEDGTGRGTPLTTAFNLRGRDEGARVEVTDAASLRASSGGSSRSYVAQQSVRRLTPIECERLQSFPDGHTILPETLAANPDEPNPKPDSHRYAQMGNAVTVNVAEWIGRRIVHGRAA